jgi:hypothetical protein
MMSVASTPVAEPEKPPRPRVAAMPSAPLAAQENALSSVFVWSLVLVAVVIGGFWLVSILKRRLKSGDDEPASIGFTLSDLREMHRSGQLSDAEFERARTKMAASLKKDLKQAPVSRQSRADQGGPGSSGKSSI